MKNKINYIAELCQNHLGKISNIEKMIYETALNGANIIKTQYIFSKNLAFRPEFENGVIIKNKKYIIKRPYLAEYNRLKKLDLKFKDYEKFIKICEKNNVTPMITCFTREHVKDLKNIGFKYIKVASYDCASFQMLKELKSNFNNIIVSTGATYDQEIKYASKILNKLKKFVLLHCVSIYPTPFNELNLKRISFLKKYSKEVGFSDHSVGIDENKNFACKAAIYFGATYLERHIRIFESEKTKDGIVSILPSDIKDIIMFSKLSKNDQHLHLKDKYKIKFKTTLGFKNRNLSHTELLNRNYYRGRFASFKKNKVIDNWEEIPL
jgi:N,N'-diacetyllegionaminate synthase